MVVLPCRNNNVCQLFGGQAGAGAGPGLFDVPVPADQWNTKLQLALEQEMLGLSGSGHPLHGVEHILVRQSDTPIASILDGTVSDGSPGDRMVGVNVAEDGIVLVKARLIIRDDQISLIANDLVVPDLAQAGAGCLS